MSRILLTGCGGAAAIGVARSLRRFGHTVIGVDSDPYHLLRAEVSDRYLVPACVQDGYLPVLKQIIAEQQIDFLHAQNDHEVHVLSSLGRNLGATVFLPADEVVGACQDKWQSYRLWRNAGLTVPQTYVPTSANGVVVAMETIGREVWIRPRQGAGGRGALRTREVAAARAWIEEGLGYGHYTLARCLTDRSVTWMSLWHEGRLVVAQGRERLSWEGHGSTHVSGSTGVGMTISDAVLDRVAQRAIAAIDPRPHGLYGVDCTLDDAGVPNPTEINVGRCFTTIEFFTRAGLNLPALYVAFGLGVPVRDFMGAPVLNPLEHGLLWIRGMDVEPVQSYVGDVEASQERLRSRLAGLLV